MRVPQIHGAITDTDRGQESTHLYVGTSQGEVVGFDGRRLFFEHSFSSPITAIKFDATTKSLWVGTETEGLFRIQEDEVSHFTTSNGFVPGAVHKKHRHENCDEIYHVISGHGLAGAGSDRAEVRGGHFHFIPKGVEHWLHNLSDAGPIEVVGIYIGAGSVEETGYVYTGEVTEEDIRCRTA